MEKLQIRNARVSDAEGMLAIYEPYVKQTPVSFETEVPTLIDFQNKIKKLQENFPWFVAEFEGKIIGYAYASTFRERAAYNWSCESSIYIDPSFQGKRIGNVSPARALYELLFSELKAQGMKQVLGVITVPNEQSIRFHEKMGFQAIGVFKSIGFKMNAWHDVWFGTLFLEPLPFTAPTE